MTYPSSFIKLEPDALKAINVFFTEKRIHKNLRIDLAFKGCCDPALELRISTPESGDLHFEQDGVTILMRPDVFDLVGEVTIAYLNAEGKRGFILKPVKAISEWDGFGANVIKI